MKLDAFESESTEFKETVNESAIKTIAAFANCHGGRIYIGVSDDGEILGVNDVDEELLRLTNKMRTNIRPDVLMMTSVEVEHFEEKAVIVVTVQRGSKRPYYLVSKGLRSEGVYVRSGAASIPTSETAMLQMIQESANDSFETRVSNNQSLTFDFARGYFEQAGLTLGEAEMRTLGLVEKGAFTNLALLLSDQCPSFVKAASFDDDSRDTFLEREGYSGSILSQLEQGYAFLQGHNKFKTRYEGLRRIDFADYPELALREALVNAVAHREYALSGPTLISIMPSSVEIVSLGGLVPGITRADLEANISMPRNKRLAALMYRLGVIEAWGTGIGRMRNAYENRKGAVEISLTPNTFTVALANRNATLEDGAVEDPDKAAVIDAIRNGCQTRAQIQDQVGFSQSKTINLLREMVEEGLLIRTGGSRSIRYALAD